MKEILLFSGGMDSLILWYWLQQPNCLFVDVGQRYYQKEFSAVTDIAHETGMDLIYKEMRVIGEVEKPDADMPQRNMFLLMLGSNYADKVYLTIQKDEFSIPDRKPAFFKEAEKIVSYLHNRPIKFPVPFETMDKFDIVEWYKDMGHPIDLLQLTVGCYTKSKSKHCGNCGSCFRRATSLAYNDIDPETTLSPDIVKTYMRWIEEGKYSPERAKKTIIALEKMRCL